MLHRALLLAAASGLSLSAHASVEMARAKNCMACHAVERKIVGPSFKDVAAKYAKDKKAEATLMDKIAKGGKGVWGEQVMPPNAHLKPEELRLLARWILTLK